MPTPFNYKLEPAGRDLPATAIALATMSAGDRGLANWAAGNVHSNLDAVGPAGGVAARAWRITHSPIGTISPVCSANVVELGGKYHAPCRMVPADVRFETERVTPALKIEDRLVVELELSHLDCDAEAGFPGCGEQVLDGIHIPASKKRYVPRPSVLAQYSATSALVQQILGLAGIGGCQCDPETEAPITTSWPVNCIRFAEAGDDPVRRGRIEFAGLIGRGPVRSQTRRRRGERRFRPTARTQAVARRPNGRRASPIGCPSVSLTVLKQSEVKARYARARCRRRRDEAPAPSARGSRSRLGRSVRASCVRHDGRSWLPPCALPGDVLMSGDAAAVAASGRRDDCDSTACASHSAST